MPDRQIALADAALAGGLDEDLVERGLSTNDIEAFSSLLIRRLGYQLSALNPHLHYKCESLAFTHWFRLCLVRQPALLAKSGVKIWLGCLQALLEMRVR